MKRALSLGLLSLMVACGSSWTQAPSADVPYEETPRTPAAKPTTPEKPPEFTLSNAPKEVPITIEGPAPIPSAPMATKLLTDKEVASLLSRVGDPPKEESKPFFLREGSLPPPKVGAVVLGEFPPTGSATKPEIKPETKPLEVLRYEPTGGVTPNDRVIISFTRPMVGLTTLSALSKEEVPVKISPQPKGTWRWIGTKILEFTPSEPMAKATKYTVIVPSGTRSVAGEILEKEVSFSFTTEAASIAGSYPSGDEVTPGGLFFFEFNQAVDAQKIAAVTHGKMGVSKLPLRLSTPEEIAKDKIVSKLYAKAPKGTAVVFTPEKEIPLATKVKVKVGPNIPSAEGPLTASGGQYLEFSTYAPLKIENVDCGYDGRCESYDAFEFLFNNDLDLSSIDKSQVTIEPALPKAVVSVSTEGVYVTGNKPAGRYWVTLPAGIKDVFGQEIEQEIAMEFRVVGERDGWRYRYEEVSASAGSFTIMRPEDSKRFPVRTQNVGSFRITVYQVELKDWLKDPYVSYDEKGYPGTKVLSEVYRVKDKEKDESAVTYVDLSPALKDGTGQLLVEIEERGLFDVFKERSTSWVQVTKLGVDTFYDSMQLHAWVNNLSDGSSVEGAELTLLEMKSSYEGGKWSSKIVNKQEVKTDDSGMGLLLPPSALDTDRIVIVAKKGNDSVFLQDLRKVSAPSDRFLWYVTDGRRLYRPGEEVKIKGWLRYQQGGAGEPVVAAPSGITNIVNFIVRDQRYNEITKGLMILDETGGFSTSFKLSNTVNLGNITVVLTASELAISTQNSSYNFVIEAQEYRRPEFEVKAELDPGPYYFGDKILPKTLATYFAGGGLSKATLNWNVTSNSTNFVPPNQSEYSFGPGDHWSAMREYKAQHSESWKAETNEDGEHSLQIAYSKDGGLYPRSLAGSVTVYDVNRQAFSGSFTTIVHPASVYVGLKTERPFAKTKEPLVVEAIAANIDGDIVEGKSISIALGRYGWSEDENKYTLLDAQTCDKVSTTKVVTCSFSPKKEGLYQINASVKDEKGRENRSQLYRYVVGDTGGSELIESKAEFLADKTEYAPGDTAELLLLAPFFPAEGVLRVRHGELVDTQRFTVSGATVLLPVKIEKEMYPSLMVEVELIGSSVVDKEKIPAYAAAAVSLSVPAKDRKLTVEVTPKESELLPGSDTSMEIVLKDKDGKPVEGEAAIFVVDESLLALSGFTMPDPTEYFYQASQADFASYRTRERLYLPKKKEFSKEIPIDASGVTVTGASISEYELDGDDMKREAFSAELASDVPRAPMKTREMLGGMKKKYKSADMASPSPRQDPGAGSFGPPPVGAASTDGIALRSAFDSLAFFQERVKIDATGKATVKYKLQDSLTRYRIMVVAASGVQKFGTGESNITARLPLMVRPSPPRFLLQGDQAEVSVVLQNQTKESMKLSVALRGSLTSLATGKGYQMEIPANDRREIRFPLKALAAGSTTIQVAASDGTISDAAEVKLPIYTPATTEAFAMYGEIDEGAISQPVKVGDDVNVEFGGLQVSMSSTALSSLTDAVLYLMEYPYECAEQRASRLLGILSLKDFLFEFKAEGLPSKEALNAIIEKDLAELSKLQHNSGGFGFFSSDEKPWPYTSIHVTHALVRAKLAGYAVNETTLSNAKSYIDQIRRYRLFTGRPSEAEKLSMDAYVVYVLRLFGDKDSFSENRLDDKIDTLPLEALGWIMPSLSKEKQEIAYKRLLKLVEETAGAAHFTTSYDNGAYYLLGSARRTDAILLEALIDTDPKNELIPKLVKGLMMARVKGRWASTQENMFTLLALKKYFEVYEKATPDFVARVWLGEGYAGEHTFKGRTTETYSLTIPMKEVVAKKSTSLFVSKEGAGRVYYRLGLSYAPMELNVPALESGFTVSRTYEAVDDPADVTKNKDGSWSVKAGAKVKVKVSMVAPGLRYHVALVDPMPAGFEAENPTLKASVQNTDSDPSEWGYYGRNYTWYQHQNLRDERAEAFSMYLFEGAYSYEYFARATTPGIFIAPPAKAEEMYAPETFGRSASDKVIVVE